MPTSSRVSEGFPQLGQGPAGRLGMEHLGAERELRDVLSGELAVDQAHLPLDGRAHARRAA